MGNDNGLSAPLALLSRQLVSFRPCFSRRAAFSWFVVVVVGFIVRFDCLGVTSFIRAWNFPPLAYHQILHFFHSLAWSLPALLTHWQRLCFKDSCNVIVNNRFILLGDHCYGPKDATKMPGVVTLHQNSETASKPSFFRGHNWAFLAIVRSLKHTFWAVPLGGTIDQGLTFSDDPETTASLTTRMVQRAISLAQLLNQPCYLVLDAFFACGPVFTLARSIIDTASRQPFIHIITRAKKSIVAYEPLAHTGTKKRGRPRKTGVPVKLFQRYHQDHRDFRTASCRVYDTVETITYLARVLYWKPLKANVLFVMAQTSRGFIIVMSSDLTLAPLTLIELYCRRATIEHFFSLLKNCFGAFCYHFWLKGLPRQQRRPSKNSNNVIPTHLRPAVALKKEAMERFVNLAAIAIGICHTIAAQFHEHIWQTQNLWLRTYTKTIPSVYITKVLLTTLIKGNIPQINNQAILRLLEQTAADDSVRQIHHDTGGLSTMSKTSDTTTSEGSKRTSADLWGTLLSVILWPLSKYAKL